MNNKKCPNCGECKLIGVGSLGMIIFFSSFILFFFGIFIFPILFAGFILAGVGALITIISIIAKIAGKSLGEMCTNCHYQLNN